MPRGILVLICLPILMAFQGPPAKRPLAGQQQTSTGPCSPNLSNTGAVTIVLSGSGCSAVDPSLIKKINQLLADFPSTLRRLLELLNEKDVQIETKLSRVAALEAQVKELDDQLKTQSDPVAVAAKSMLKSGADISGILGLTSILNWEAPVYDTTGGEKPSSGDPLFAAESVLIDVSPRRLLFLVDSYSLSDQRKWSIGLFGHPKDPDFGFNDASPWRFFKAESVRLTDDDRLGQFTLLGVDRLNGDPNVRQPTFRVRRLEDVKPRERGWLVQHGWAEPVTATASRGVCYGDNELAFSLPANHRIRVGPVFDDQGDLVAFAYSRRNGMNEILCARPVAPALEFLQTHGVGLR